jgi:DNA-binding SARP family transcriptional activator
VLLAALLLRPRQAHSADALADSLWAGQPPREPDFALRNYISRLRRGLGAAGRRIVTSSTGYLLEASDGELDTWRFAELNAQGIAEVRAGSYANGVATLEAALATWRGEILADIPSQRLYDEHAHHWSTLRLGAAESLLEAKIRLGRTDQAISELRRLTAKHPERERLWWLLIHGLDREGRRIEALATYHRMRLEFVRELGVEPGAELQDLQRSILAGRRHRDQRPVEPAAPCQLPATTPHFVGRAQELRTLTGRFEEGRGPRTVTISVLCGMPGSGKTALAVHWAHQVAARFPDGQLYVNLRGFGPDHSPMEPADVLYGLLDALGVAPERVPPSLDAMSAHFRSALSDRRVLLVLDNARDSEQVRPLLPGSPNCLVVVTSRDQLAGLITREGAEPLLLGLLTAEEADELLRCRLGTVRVSREPRAAEEVVDLCGRLPLALSLAAARAAVNPGLTLARLAAELRHAPTRLDAFDTGDPTADLRAAFCWSYRRLGAAAARMFLVLGGYHGTDISVGSAAALTKTTPSHAHSALNELTRAHLLTESAPGRFRMHELLRAYAREVAMTPAAPPARRTRNATGAHRALI